MVIVELRRGHGGLVRERQGGGALGGKELGFVPGAARRRFIQKGELVRPSIERRRSNRAAQGARALSTVPYGEEEEQGNGSEGVPGGCGLRVGRPSGEEGRKEAGCGWASWENQPKTPLLLFFLC